MGVMNKQRIKIISKRFHIFRLMKQYNNKLTLSEIAGEVKLSTDAVRGHLRYLNLKTQADFTRSHEFMARPNAASLMGGRGHRTEHQPIRMDYD